MSAIVGRFVGALAFAVLVSATVIAFGLTAFEDTAAVFLLVLGALGLLALVRAVHAAAPPVRPPLFERSLRRPREHRGRPPELTRLEVDLAFGAENAAQLHSRVVPVLRLIAAGRLGSRHGVDLAHRPDAARTVLGEDLWQLVRPDRPAPEDLLAPGLPLRRLAEAVTTLEQL